MVYWFGLSEIVANQGTSSLSRVAAPLSWNREEEMEHRPEDESPETPVTEKTPLTDPTPTPDAPAAEPAAEKAEDPVEAPDAPAGEPAAEKAEDPVEAPDAPAGEPAAEKAEDPVEVPDAPAGEPAAEKAEDPVEAPDAPAGEPAAEKAEADGEDFAKMLKESEEKNWVEPRKGLRVQGKIVRIGEDAAFVDFGGKAEGSLDLKEIAGEEGNPAKKVGDQVTAVISEVDGGVRLALRAGKRQGSIRAMLEAAESKLPVEGKVVGTNKGGLVVSTKGLRAFCPFSQIDRHFVEDAKAYLGKKFSFRVISADRKGRNVILSRRVILDEEARGNATQVRETLEVGSVLTGVVSRIRPFGAFVDLGGLDGLVHVSEISFGRVANPNDALKVGQEVQVKVVKLEDLGGEKERVSLSIRQLLEDPWKTMTETMTPGQWIEGKVVRLADFGAFVEVAPGVDGLVHVSELADHRVENPSEVLTVGQDVKTRVVRVDSEARRISLSLLEESASPERQSGGRPEGGRGSRGRQSGRDRGDRNDRGGSSRGATRASSGDAGGMTSMGEAFERLRERTTEE
jgi:predicted RNA-binding protein with RPS1 domain